MKNHSRRIIREGHVSIFIHFMVIIWYPGMAMGPLIPHAGYNNRRTLLAGAAICYPERATTLTRLDMCTEKLGKPNSQGQIRKLRFSVNTLLLDKQYT